MLWEEAAEREFPEDEDEFEESVVEIREKLFGILFDDSRKYRAEYFLTGYESAFKIVDAWLADLKGFNDVYNDTNKETYMEMRMLLDEDSSETTKKEVAFMLLEKSIPEEPTETELDLYDRLWLLRWYHDVVFHLRRYDDLFQEGEYTEDNFEQWAEDWVGYERLDLYSLCADVYEYLHLPQDDKFGRFAQTFISSLNIPRSFFAYLEERRN